jgi:heme-degrading monooxygenase HmoA
MISKTPEPPYYACIFTSLRHEQAGDGYAEMSKFMMRLAEEQPGFLGAESARNADGLGLTVSYWRSTEDIRNWKANLDHQVAQKTGKVSWYEAYQVRICRVEQDYGFTRDI